MSVIVFLKKSLRNIFLKNNRIKLGDFGLSQLIEVGIDKLFDMSGLGTVPYMSPEMLNKKGCLKSDVWLEFFIFNLKNKI
jgi:NIMA (never in mitosis gene a)-related kinase 11